MRFARRDEAALLLLLLLLPPGSAWSGTIKEGNVVAGVDDIVGGGRGRGRGRDLDRRGRRNARNSDGIPTDPSELRPCGQLIGTATKDEVLDVAEALVLGTLPSEFSAIATPVVTAAIKFGVRSWKICASCEEMMEAFGGAGELDSSEENGFLSYCGPDIVGHDSVFSGLLLEPIEIELGLPPVGKVKASVWARGSETDQFRIPSERWPTDLSQVSEVVAASDPITFALAQYLDLLGPLMAATSGTYAFIADGKGYGEDHENSPGYLIRRTYQTSFVPLWFYGKQFVSKSTNGCTVIDDVAYLGGYSEGGYAIVSIAFALQELGVDIVGVSAGGGPYSIASAQAMGVIESIDSGRWPSGVSHTLPLLGHSYSSTDPLLPNTNTGQDLLAEEWMDQDNFEMNAIAWIESGLNQSEILRRIPENPLDLFDIRVLDFFRSAAENNITDPCVTDVTVGTNDKFCAALLENDLTDLLMRTTFPITFCHSPDDDIVSIKNIPDLTNNSQLSQLGFPPVMGSHFQAGFSCVLGSLLPFTTFGFDPDEVSGINPPDDEGCNVPGANTVVPDVASPSGAPTLSSTQPPEGEGAPQSSAYGASFGVFSVLVSLSASIVLFGL